MGEFSVFGSTVFDEEVRQILKHIKGRFLESVDADKIKALVLGGGYGRSEGGVLFTEKGERLYNDLDFFVISKNLPIWEQKKLNKKLKPLHHELSELYGIDVDFSDVKPVSSLARMPFTLMWYDLKCGHKVLWGNKRVMQYLPEWNPDDMPPMEANKLLLNRSMGLYFSKCFLDEDSHDREVDFINRNIHKSYQAMSEAILISEKEYHWSVQERMQRISRIDISKYTSFPQAKELMLKGMEFKLKPQIVTPDKQQLSSRLNEAIKIMKEVYLKVWGKYFGQELAAYGEYKELLSTQEMKPSISIRSCKNVLYNLRDQKGLHGKFLINLCYPRYRLFYALPWLLFDEKLPDEELNEALGLKPGTDHRSAAEHFVNLWRRYN